EGVHPPELNPRMKARPTHPPLPLSRREMLFRSASGFGAVALAQATFPLWASHPAAVGLRVHLSNGLYANAIFDRLLGGWRQKPTL
ncbi:MAG: hypothetical protein ACO37E_09915, partial [Lutimaribacter sp.]